MKRTISILLALASMLAVSCGGEGSSESTTAASGETSASAPAETTVSPYEAELPDVRYDGYEFTVSSQERAWYHGNWTVEEQNGDVLNDAIFKRNSAVCDRFGITISEYQVNDNNFARTAVMSGDDEYDLIHVNSGNALAFAEEGLLLEVGELPHLDLSKAYYSQAVNEALTICGKLYFPVGAVDLTMYDYTHVMLFNKDIVADDKLESPYELVSSGNWTLETYDGMVKNATRDLDGNSEMDENDRWGYLSQPKHVLPCFWVASEVLSVNRDKSGDPVFTMASDQKFVEVFEKIFAITYDNGSWYKNTIGNNADQTLQNMFDANKALFLNTTFYYIEGFRSMDADFGIIPYPKYDKAQENYLSRTEGANFVCVPVTAGDPERTSVILEALNCESARTVIPAYYDVALKGKLTRDNESADMLDLIFNNCVFDLGDTIWCDTIRDGVFNAMFSNDDRALASKMASMQSAIDEKIAATVEAFAK